MSSPETGQTAGEYNGLFLDMAQSEALFGLVDRMLPPQYVVRGDVASLMVQSNTTHDFVHVRVQNETQYWPIENRGSVDSALLMGIIASNKEDAAPHAYELMWGKQASAGYRIEAGTALRIAINSIDISESDKNWLIEGFNELSDQEWQDTTLHDLAAQRLIASLPGACGTGRRTHKAWKAQNSRQYYMNGSFVAMHMQTDVTSPDTLDFEPGNTAITVETPEHMIYGLRIENGVVISELTEGLAGSERLDILLPASLYNLNTQAASTIQKMIACMQAAEISGIRKPAANEV